MRCLRTALPARPADRPRNQPIWGSVCHPSRSGTVHNRMVSQRLLPRSVRSGPHRFKAVGSPQGLPRPGRASQAASRRACVGAMSSPARICRSLPLLCSQCVPHRSAHRTTQWLGDAGLAWGSMSLHSAAGPRRVPGSFSLANMIAASHGLSTVCVAVAGSMEECQPFRTTSGKLENPVQRPARRYSAGIPILMEEPCPDIRDRE